MDIDLGILRTLEREKEIPFVELVSIIEAAILAAYYKNMHLDPKEHKARAVLDQKTGSVHIFEIIWNEETRETTENEVTPENFGRIAAYSAKQVIAQRLREINDEGLLGEFKGKEGDIVAGVIQQGPRAYMIHVDLGSIEAVLPPEEQVAGEEYTHGKRIRVLVTNVNKGTRGPQVTVSRSHPTLVRKLFALEVPEIANGTVEIVQVAREAGHRTKIAVRAHEAGVNAKGACIGELGQRVRAVSAELNDEKIDIVDYNTDICEFVSQALSPAKVSSAYIIGKGDPKASGDARVTHVRALVPDYQLSLAIGKEGQNVRLAAKLTGAKIDVQPESILEGDE
jgi:N utilization substance protein A